MAEKGYFFDSTEDDQRIYSAADFARFHAPIIGNGFSNTKGSDNLKVTAKNNMEIQVAEGLAYNDGYMYENDSSMTLEHDVADPDNDRIDRIIIRFDNNPEERRFYASIKKGTPGEDTPPSLTNDEYITEIAVAQVKINAGQSFIEDEDITDERDGNYIDLHNLKRGVKVNEDGIATMPNQSFINIRTENPDYSMKYRESKYFPLGEALRDHQGEVSEGNIIPKADGVYYVWIHISSRETDVYEGADVQVYMERNGEGDEWPILAHVTQSNIDNIWISSTVTTLKADDNIKFLGFLQHGDKDIPLRTIWIRFAKIS